MGDNDAHAVGSALTWVSSLPWLIPGCLVALVLSTMLSDSVARWLDVRRPIAWLLLLSTGVILAGTLTPLVADSRINLLHPGRCDLSRTGLPSYRQLVASDDVIGNILMFIPLGAAIALVPRSPRKTAVLVAAIALPFVIEAIQLFVIPLDRACQSADVVDNLTGLFIGLAAGAVVAALAPLFGRAAPRDA